LTGITDCDIVIAIRNDDSMTRRRSGVTLAEKIRYLREVEGQLRGLGRAMTQQEMVRALSDEGDGKGLSQSYLSQIESGARPHLTNTTRLLLANFFKVHPGYLVDDPPNFQAELRTLDVMEDQLDLWLVAGADRFGRRDPELCRALLALAHHDDSRGCLLLLEQVIRTPELVGRLKAVLQPVTASGPCMEDAMPLHETVRNGRS
jgi:transcriptional regulator with XRE-family HTH domain